MKCENVITWKQELERGSVILKEAPFCIPLLYLEITDPDIDRSPEELVANLHTTNNLLKACEPHKPEDQNFTFLKNIQEEILKQLGRL